MRSIFDARNVASEVFEFVEFFERIVWIVFRRHQVGVAVCVFLIVCQRI